MNSNNQQQLNNAFSSSSMTNFVGQPQNLQQSNSVTSFNSLNRNGNGQQHQQQQFQNNNLPY